MILCADTPVPTFDSLYSALVPYLTLPDFKFTIPPLPALPNPVMPEITCDKYSLVQIAQQLQSYQYMITFESILKPITSYLGMSLDSILPKITGTSITLIDLLSLDATLIYNEIKLALINKVKFPLVPDPLFKQITAPDIQLNLTVKMIINDYLNSLSLIVESLIEKVTDKLKLPGLPKLPKIPTVEDLISLIMSKIPGYPSIFDLFIEIPNFNIGLLLSKITINPFPALPAFPSPLVPTIMMPEVEFNEGLVLMYTNFSNYILSIIVNFCNKTISFLGFSFPTICIPL
jgi:hypothetical protein